MPYINKLDRPNFEANIIELVCKLTADNPGDINYLISSIIWRLFKRYPNYKNANTLLGVLEAVKLEFYRRVVSPYEDKKIQENGDIIS
jgi:hypothetical protein